MISQTNNERQLRLVLTISAWTYVIVGFVFALLPEQLMDLVNQLSSRMFPGLPLIQVSPAEFWVALSFSMMMTIATICFIAAVNIRRNKVFIIPLLVAKSASALSGLAYFILSARFLACLLIFIVDGAIFLTTLFFYLRANRAYFEEQTAWFRRKPKELKETGETTVVSLTADDKFKLLDDVLNQAGFFTVLTRAFEKSGKTGKADFAIVIKPNFMFMHSRKDHSSYTDPQLVEALVDRIAGRGFSNVTLVEAQSTYGNYYRNREVVKVAEYIGYTAGRNYRIVDLTEEMVPYDYGGRLGFHFVGPTWRDADFRISFAKNKTHVFCHYTLTLKNIYGTLPMQNKLKEYHTKREYDWPTIETLKHFPVHFGIIDAFYSADGQIGVIVDAEPNFTRTIIAGENLMAVDWVGAKKMGLDPDDPRIGRFLPLAVEAFGKPVINWVGDRTTYRPWHNVNELFIKSLDIIEEAYAFSNWWFAGLTAMDGYFSFKWQAWPIKILRLLLAPFKRFVYRNDRLP